jgi:predicted KAP-like P-loop ATPase
MIPDNFLKKELLKEIEAILKPQDCDADISNVQYILNSESQKQILKRKEKRISSAD